MAEIKEVFEDIKEGLGDKGFLIFIAAAALFFLYNLTKTDSNSESLTAVTTVASYPDAVTNANVIIDTLQESISYSEQEIIEAMQGGFTATEDYIKTGLESAAEMHEKIDNMGAQLDTNTNISAMTYYEQMLEQSREGFINSGNTELTIKQALGALENAGFDTSTEKGTASNGLLIDKPGSEGGGYTTFTEKESPLTAAIKTVAKKINK